MPGCRREVPGQFYGGGGMNTCVAHEEIREQLRDHEKKNSSSRKGRCRVCDKT